MIRFALKSLAGRKLRTSLTALAIAGPWMITMARVLSVGSTMARRARSGLFAMN